MRFSFGTSVVFFKSRLLQEVRAHHDIAISWIKAHTGGSSPDALGNAAADLLAARGRSGSSSAVVRPPVRPRRSRRHRSSSPSDPLRRSSTERGPPSLAGNTLPLASSPRRSSAPRRYLS